jgi:glycosyltransferase involved in cell wall biosynthesis
MAFERRCGMCPQLHSSREGDLSRWIWKRKASAWRDVRITVAAPSRWMAEGARRSSLFGKARIEVIPNGVDISLYQPMDRTLARQRLGIASNRLWIMFTAMMATSDVNKGFTFLQAALRRLAAVRKDVEAVIVGAGEPANPPDVGVPSLYMGRCQDDATMALLYAAADVLVVPSIEENCPNTILEAMATGVPSVAFKVGGIPDLIKHEATGYLAVPFDPEDLCRGIWFVLEDSARKTLLSQDCRRRAVSEYDIALTTKRYAALYDDILKDPRESRK